MILSLIYYLIFSALFYLTYRVSYARLSFHKFNRAALLLMPALALGIAIIAPQINFSLWSEDLPVWQLPEIQIEGKALKLEQVREQNLPSSWTLIYLLGLSLSAVYFLIGIQRLLKLVKGANVEETPNYRLYWSSHIQNAFCFGPYIFIPEKLRGHQDLSLVIEHEIHHKNLGHLWDRLYYRILTILLWFDPFIHAFARELRQVHEFEVDAQLVQHKNIEDYAHTLLRSTLGADLQFPEKALAPSPFFNSSLIKSRITMMYSNQSRPWRKALYAFILPLALGMSVLACNKAEADQEPIVAGKESNSLKMNEIEELPVVVGVSNVEASPEQRKAQIFEVITNHIVENFKYPELAEKEGLEGKIFVSFVIETDGSIGEVEIIKSLETSNAEQETAREQAEVQARELIASLPKFAKPAYKDGKPVRMEMVLPIALKLD